MDANPPVVDEYSRLLSLAVHELRTPASVVGGYLRMLQTFSDPPLGETQQKMVSEAGKACARIVALIAELSEISKLDAGTAAVSQADIDLFLAAEEVANNVQEARDRGVRVEVRGEPSGATIRGDAVRLRAALDACFRAIAREQPEAAIVAAERRLVSHAGVDSAVIVVTEETNVSKAYDAAPAPFDEKRGGLGLALPIARRVIERHGGHLSSPVTSTVPAIVIAVPLSGSGESRS